jgi:hypothetical protein
MALIHPFPSTDNDGPFAGGDGPYQIQDILRMMLAVGIHGDRPVYRGESRRKPGQNGCAFPSIYAMTDDGYGCFIF